jgi:hypothetical protein
MEKRGGSAVKFPYTLGKPEVFPVEGRAEMAAIQQCRQPARHRELRGRENCF